MMSSLFFLFVSSTCQHVVCQMYTTAHAPLHPSNVIGLLNNTLVTSCHITCQNMLTCANIAVTSLDGRDERVDCYLLSDVQQLYKSAAPNATKAYVLKKVDAKFLQTFIFSPLILEICVLVILVHPNNFDITLSLYSLMFNSFRQFFESY